MMTNILLISISLISETEELNMCYYLGPNHSTGILLSLLSTSVASMMIISPRMY